MRPARIIGLAAAYLLVVSMFFLPFSMGAESVTLYEIVRGIILNLDAIQASLDEAFITSSALVLVGFILLIITTFRAGVLGVVGMGILTYASTSQVAGIQYGAGFYLAWIAAVISVAARAAARRARKEVKEEEEPKKEEKREEQETRPVEEVKETSEEARGEDRETRPSEGSDED